MDEQKRSEQLQHMLDVGRAKIERDRQERERREKEEMDTQLALANIAWDSLLDDVCAHLPKCLHAWINVRRPDDLLELPRRDDQLVSLDIPSLSPISFRMFRPWGKGDVQQDGYSRSYEQRTGYQYVTYYLGQPYCVTVDGMWAIGNKLSKPIDDLPMALAMAEYWWLKRQEIEVEVTEKNATLEADRAASKSEQPPETDAPRWRMTLDSLEAELDRSESSDSPVATQAAIAYGLKALVEFLHFYNIGSLD